MTGAELIAEERRRQQEKLGWTAAHDAHHTSHELVRAAVCYALPDGKLRETLWFDLWPWDGEWWKPEDRLRDLTKAGALIAAEIDRIQADRESRTRAAAPWIE